MKGHDVVEKVIAIGFGILLASVAMAGTEQRIDRHALVARHNIQWDQVDGRLALGNGEFCFGVDGTGLQTFSGNTMAHWGWHRFPLPEGFQPADVPATGNPDRGHIHGEMAVPRDREALYHWMYQNPHRLNLGRLRLCRAGGAPLTPGDVTKLSRRLDLWTGLQTASFEVDGQAVRVETCVHGTLDAVAVRIESPLLARGELAVSLEFPYGSLQNGPCVGDWTKPAAHTTRLTRPGPQRADFARTVDATRYVVSLAWTGKGELQEVRRHSFTLTSGGEGALEFVCALGAGPLQENVPGASAWASPANLTGTKSAENCRRCRLGTASIISRRPGRTRTPAATRRTPIRSASAHSCLLWTVWTLKYPGARPSAWHSRGSGDKPGVGISPGWRWPQPAWASRAWPSSRS